MELKDIIHYYIGQPCEISSLSNGYNWAGSNPTIIDFHICTLCKETVWNIKPILRTIDSLTHEEIENLFSILGWRMDMTAVKKRICLFTAIENEDYECENDDGFLLFKEAVKMIPYLLSLGIDIFGLIESGIAININEC